MCACAPQLPYGFSCGRVSLAGFTLLKFEMESCKRKDPSSSANSGEVVVSHWDWEVAVDFEKKALRCTATLHIRALREGVGKLVRRDVYCELKQYHGFGISHYACFQDYSKSVFVGKHFSQVSHQLPKVFQQITYLSPHTINLHHNHNATIVIYFVLLLCGNT